MSLFWEKPGKTMVRWEFKMLTVGHTSLGNFDRTRFCGLRSKRLGVKPRGIVLAAAVHLACCSSNQGTGAGKERDAAIPPGGWKIDLQLGSLFPGATNATRTPVLTLSPGSLKTTRNLAVELQSNMVFASTDGQDVIPASVTTIDPLGSSDPASYDYAVAPVAPLRANAWYDLRWPAAADITIHSDDLYDLGVDVLTRFYTGSGLQLRKLEIVRKGDEPARGLLVYLSELVDLWDVQSGGIVVAASPSLSGGCITWYGGCLTVDSGAQRSAIFQYEFTSDVPAHFELAMALSLRGEAKTVREAVEAGAVRGATAVNDQFLLYEMDTTTWPQRIDPARISWSNAE
jgi:hypothetical protein